MLYQQKNCTNIDSKVYIFFVICIDIQIRFTVFVFTESIWFYFVLNKIVGSAKYLFILSCVVDKSATGFIVETSNVFFGQGTNIAETKVSIVRESLSLQLSPHQFDWVENAVVDQKTTELNIRYINNGVSFVTFWWNVSRCDFQ